MEGLESKYSTDSTLEIQKGLRYCIKVEGVGMFDKALYWKCQLYNIEE